MVRNRVESLQEILRGIEFTSEGYLLAGNFYYEGCYDALGCIGTLHGLKEISTYTLTLDGRVREEITPAFRNMIHGINDYVRYEIQMLADRHTKDMSYQKRHSFMVNAIMDAIQNRGNWIFDESFNRKCEETDCPCHIFTLRLPSFSAN